MKTTDTLKKFFEESRPGETRVFLREEECPIPFCEPIYMTNLNGAAVLVHFGTDGDWTRAVLIPGGEFENGRAEDALDWFFYLD